MLILEPARTGMPSLYQVMTGRGFPIAEHGSTAIDLTGKVWLVGPNVIIGGGWSSGDVTVRRDRQMTEPAGFTAEHTTTVPESFRVTD